VFASGRISREMGSCCSHAECEDLLPQLPPAIAAAAITDPPYCSGGTSAGERARDPRVKYCHSNNACGRPSFGGDHRDQRSFAFWSTLWTRMLARLVEPSGYCLVFTDWRQLPTMTDVLQAGGFVYRGLVSWNKGRGARAPHKGYFRHQCEYVVWGTNGACRKAVHAGPFDGCIDASVKKSDKFHMTGKPTAVLQQLVECVPPGGLVLDPFAGSGTTGVACARTGRRFIGIERSADYCAIAAERFERALASTGRTAA
jgi:site-specific DNA-methyltransferase (adenine-specific)